MDPGIFVRGGAVEARRPENSLDNAFLVINLFYSLQSGSNGFITEDRRGSNFFQGVGVSKETHITYDFPGGGLPPSYIGSELTRKGVCEQAEHVMSPQGIRRMMKTRTNQPMQKYRCSYKAFKWSKHSQKRKLWVFLQYEGREMYYSDS